MNYQQFDFEEFKARYSEDKHLSILLPIFLIIFTIILDLIKFNSNRRRDFTYWWFLINGLWIHIFLDGLVGLLEFVQPLVYLYNLLDKRYHDREPIVVAISTLELYFYGPLCILIIIFYKKNYSEFWLQCMRMILSIIQLLGTLFFVSNAYSRNFIDVCGTDCYSFTTENIIFFWIFFVAANPVWIIVPSYQIHLSMQELIKPNKNFGNKMKLI